MRLQELRQKAGQTQVNLDSFELEHGCCGRDPEIIRQHDELLIANIEAKQELEVEEAILTGRMNFRPEPKKRTTTKRN